MSGLDLGLSEALDMRGGLRIGDWSRDGCQGRPGLQGVGVFEKLGSVVGFHLMCCGGQGAGERGGGSMCRFFGADHFT